MSRQDAAQAPRTLRGARVLVTGGTGFLGGWAVSALVEAGASVTVLSRNPGAYVPKSPAGAKASVVQGDLDALPRFEEPPTHLLHAASPPHRGTPPAELDRVVVSGTRKLLARFTGARTLFVSSGAAARGLTPYGAAKRRAEEAVLSAGGLVARGYAFLGPGLPLDGSFAAGDLLLDAARGGPLTLKSTGASVRSFLDAEEAGRWLAFLLEKGPGGSVLDVGSDVPVTVAELARLIARAAGLPASSVRLGPDPKADEYLPDLTAVRALGLEPAVPVETSVASALAWVRAGAPGARR